MKAGEKHRIRRKQSVERFVSVPVLMTEITCPACGAGVELWTGDDETRCPSCELEIYRKQRADH